MESISSNTSNQKYGSPSSDDHSDTSSLQSQGINPVPLVEGDLDQQISKVGSRSSNRLSLYRTETAKSLQEMGLTNVPSIPDANVTINGAQDPMFPEEYTMETTTGFVPAQTLQSLGRVRTARSGLARVHTITAQAESDLEKQKTEVDPEAEFVTFLINDPENPQNWSSAWKWTYTMIASGLVVAVAFGSSCVTGGLSLISEKYNVSQEVAILTCSLMVLGFAVGPLIWSPLSELIGRRPVYIISLSLYVIFNIPCALSPNIGGLLVCRFLCGVFSSSGLSLVGGTIADMFPKKTRGMAIAYFAAAPYCGPVVGPIVCGWINIGSGRLDLFFWVNMAFAGVMLILVGLIPETYAPVILKKRAAKLREETGNPKIMTEQEMVKMSLKEIIQTCLIRPLYLCATEVVLDLMNLYVVLIYSLLYAFFCAYPVVFGELYNYNDGIIGLMFIPIVLGACFALMTTPVVEKKYMALAEQRKPIPEDRLIGAMIGAPFIPIALWILGATSYKHIIWVGPASAGLAFGYGMVMVYYSVNNYIIDAYAKYAASALAAKVFVRSAGGAAFPLFTTQMYHKLGLQWASWLLAFISMAMVCIPLLFYKFGPRIRAKLCKEDYSD